MIENWLFAMQSVSQHTPHWSRIKDPTYQASKKKPSSTIRYACLLIIPFCFKLDRGDKNA